ncbi:hypothetical protein I4U23_024578 [Adineta vaga]|nr:hypothetical protein I4U23_024578 [Adineta vaga]
MRKPTVLNRQPTSFQIITAHCSTIRNKANSLDAQNLSKILDDIVRELKSNVLASPSYLNSLNAVLLTLRFTLPPALISLGSHYFFVLIRNTIQVLLQQLLIKYQLNQLATYVLRNCVLLLEFLVENTKDVSKLLHWITNLAFIDTIANCLNHIERIAKINDSRRFIKQITRLLDIFNDIQARLPPDEHNSLFARLLESVIRCLTSSTYVQIFSQLKPSSESTNPIEKLFLTKCPRFLATYNGPHMAKTVEQVLQVMLPRYVSILNIHMKTITGWHRSTKRAIYHLFTILVYAENYFTSYLKDELLQTLINHLLRILVEPTLIKNITERTTDFDSLLIYATLDLCEVLISEEKARDIIKKSQPTRIFERLIFIPKQNIVFKAYVLLAYVIDTNDLRQPQSYFPRLTCTVLNLMYKAVQSTDEANDESENNSEYINRNILQLTETLTGLVRHEHVKHEIIKQNALPFLIESSHKLTGLAKQFILETLWTLAFDQQLSQQLRDNSQFIHSLQSIPKSSDLSEDDLIYKMANGLLWTLFKVKDKDIVSKVKETLTNEGYTVWIDRDILQRQNMKNIGEAMNKSTVVIVCLSKWYERDNQCVCESVYASNSKRIIIPLIVERGYEMNSWLMSMIDKSALIQFDVNDLKRSNEILMKEISQHCRNKSSKIKIMTPTPNSILNGDRDHTFARIIATPTPTASGRVSISSDKQQQQNGSRPNSIPTPSGITPVSSGTPVSIMTPVSVITPIPRTTPVSTTPLPLNENYQKYFPQEYTKRDTSDATYRSIPINVWKKKDIIDFLYDHNLVLMMPLCDSMTGRGLLGFFQMCQSKPSRLFGQLNEELRSRYRGLTLPMGIYSQFLIEMDNLMNTEPNYSQQLPFSVNNDNQHLMHMPLSTAQSILEPPMAPSTLLNTPRSFETLPEEPVSYGERVVRRAVFRPASAADRPYDFSVETDDQTNLVFEQLARYENQLYALQDQAREYRERNGVF